jgi:hypothetical protein
MKKLEKKRKIMSGFDILAALLARRRRPVASSIALDPLRWSMRLLKYRLTDRASKTADNGTFLSFFMTFEPAVRLGQYDPNTRLMAASSGFS